MHAINRAIEDCRERGGGTVWLLAGTYLTGTVFVRSNVTLYLDAGSVLLGSPNVDDYPKLRGHRAPRWSGRGRPGQRRRAGHGLLPARGARGRSGTTGNVTLDARRGMG